MKPRARLLLGTVIFAILVRLCAALILGDNATPVSGAYDQISYDSLAQSVVSGRGFTFLTDSYPAVRANTPTAFWSFGYTVYLAFIYLIFGHHPLAARLIQVLLSGLNIWLIYRIGRRLFDERIGLVAAALTACYAYLIFFNAALMTQTFYILAVLAAVDIAMMLAQDSHHPLWKWFLLGGVLGAGALVRQTLLLFTPLLFAWLWWTAGRKSQISSPKFQLATFKLQVSGLKSLFTGTLLSLAIVAAFVLPWTIRNYLAFNDFLLLNSNSGFWFYSSNHPDQGTNFDPNYVAPIPESLRGLPEPAIDRALFRQAIGFIVADPVRFVLLSFNRLKDYFWLVPSEQSSIVSNLSRVLSFTLYLPFMLYGVWLSRKQWRACLPLYLYVLFDSGLCLISWSAPRYRLPSDAIMMVFAGLAVVKLAEKVRILQRQPAGL